MECDQLEMWVLAAALGANRPDEDAEPTTDESGWSFNERRAIALARGEEPPSWDDEPLTAADRAGPKGIGGIAPIMPSADTGAT